MTPLDEVLMIAGMTAVTFGVRYTPLLLGRGELPRSLLNALRYVPVAVLTAIIVPAVLIPDGSTLQFGLDNPFLVAAVIAVLVSWRTRNLLLTIIIGMASLWLYRALIGG